MKKTLSIVSSAYRAIVEEQDDTIVWINHAMKGAGANLSVLLKDNAVNYLVKSQEVPALSFGNWKQTQPPQIQRDVDALAAKGVDVFYVSEDLVERGLGEGDIIGSAKPISASDLPKLFGDFEIINQW
jgi:sulfur relay (sulfurtransferase) DsrF/TusC family protein